MFWLYNFLKLPATSSIIEANNLFCTLFLNTLNSLLSFPYGYAVITKQRSELQFTLLFMLSTVRGSLKILY